MTICRGLLGGVALVVALGGCKPYADHDSALLTTSEVGQIALGANGVANYRKLDDRTYLLVLERGAMLMASLQALQQQENLKSGSVTGLGFVRNTVIGFYDEEPGGDGAGAHVNDTVTASREIVALNCTLTTRIEGTPGMAPPHCHIVIAGTDAPRATGRGWPTVGGHLVETNVAVTAELVVTAYPTELVKTPRAALDGLPLIDLSPMRGGKALRSTSGSRR